ncbi:MAG: hypothetical protein ACK5HR_03065 [Mycoplasmatales bacterium]
MIKNLKTKQLDRKIKKVYKLLSKIEKNSFDNKASYYLQSVGADLISWGYTRNKDLIKDVDERNHQDEMGVRYHKLYQAFDSADLSLEDESFLFESPAVWVKALKHKEGFKDKTVAKEFGLNFTSDKQPQDIFKHMVEVFNNSPKDEVIKGFKNKFIEEIREAYIFDAERLYSLYLEGQDTNTLDDILNELDEEFINKIKPFTLNDSEKDKNE